MLGSKSLVMSVCLKISIFSSFSSAAKFSNSSSSIMCLWAKNLFVSHKNGSVALMYSYFSSFQFIKGTSHKFYFTDKIFLSRKLLGSYDEVLKLKITFSSSSTVPWLKPLCKIFSNSKRYRCSVSVILSIVSMLFVKPCFHFPPYSSKMLSQ